MARTAVIIIGGAAPASGAAERLPADRFVIAADSGLDHARRMGLAVDVVVGDLDSVSCGALREAEAAGVRIERHPPAKDVTDTELAIALAASSGYGHILGITGGGDRLDHALAALHAFATPALADRRVEVYWAEHVVQVVHGPGRLELEADRPAGTLVSLLPLFGPAEGVSTTGLQYPLHGETLPAASGRGVSNVRTGGQACIGIRRGTLLVISPLTVEGAP